MSYHKMMVLAAALLVAGCGDPKDVSKGNFKSALQGWFDENPECVKIGDMPAKVRSDARPGERAAYEALTAAGLLSVESRRVEQPRIMGTDMSWRPAKTGSVWTAMVIHCRCAITEAIHGSQVPVQFERSP